MYPFHGITSPIFHSLSSATSKYTTFFILLVHNLQAQSMAGVSSGIVESDFKSLLKPKAFPAT